MSHVAKTKVYVIIYSTYGHVYKLAQSVVKGAEAAGAEVKLWQVPETLSAEALAGLHAPPKPDIPVIKPDDMVDADALIFGFPTRFGGAAAQMKAFWDHTGGLWYKGALAGKVGSTFFSTGGPAGGQETTALTFLTHFAHHAIIYVPIGYTSPLLGDLENVHGGSPYGAGTISGSDGKRQPTENELKVAEHQGKYVSEVAIALKKGRHH